MVKTLDDLVKNKPKYGNPTTEVSLYQLNQTLQFEDVKAVIGEMSKLRYEIMTNKPLVTLLPEPKSPDIAVYNREVSE